MIAAVQNRRKADRRKTSRKPSWSKLAKGSYFDSVRAPVELRPRDAESQGTFSLTLLRVKRPSYGLSTGAVLAPGSIAVPCAEGFPAGVAASFGCKDSRCWTLLKKLRQMGEENVIVHKERSSLDFIAIARMGEGSVRARQGLADPLKTNLTPDIFRLF